MGEKTKMNVLGLGTKQHVYLDYEHQKRIAKKIEEDIARGQKEIVIAACCNSGKGAMMFDFCQTHSDDKILILAHGTDILRTNLNVEYKNWKTRNEDANFKPYNSSCLSKRVIIDLPQTLYRKELLPFDRLMIDEAHQFFFATMVQKILKKTNPKTIIIFTATPERFVFENSKTPENPRFSIHTIPLLELYKKGYMSNVTIDLAASTVKFEADDFTCEGDLTKQSSHSVARKQQVRCDLESFLECILLKLKSKYRCEPEKYAKIQRTFFRKKAIEMISEIFFDLEKTMIITASTKYANTLYEVLIEKMNQDDVAISHSKIEDEYGEDAITESFKTDKKQVLIVVRRGILGYNNKNLMNIVDISFSKNVSRLYQTICRLVRLNEANKNKLFIKVAPSNLAIIFRCAINGCLMLCFEEYLSTFNGKNFNDLKIPIKKTCLEKLKRNKTTSNRKQKKEIATDFIDSIEMMKDVYHVDNGLLETYAWTRLKDIEYYAGFSPRYNWTKERAFEELEKLIKEGCTSQLDIKIGSKSEDKEEKRRSANLFHFLKQNFNKEFNERLPVKKIIQEWTKESAFSELNKLIKQGFSRKEISIKRGSPWGYLSLNFKKELDKVLPVKFPAKSSILRKTWTKENAFEELQRLKAEHKDLTRSKLSDINLCLFNFLKSNFQREFYSKLEVSTPKWTKESAIKELLQKKFKFRSQLCIENSSLYNFLRLNCQEELDKFLPSIKGEKIIWTKESALKKLDDLTKSGITMQIQIKRMKKQSGLYKFLKKNCKKEFDNKLPRKRT